MDKRKNSFDRLLYYRILFVFCAVISPVITLTWKHSNEGLASSEFFGWFMSAAFFIAFIFTFISKKFLKYKETVLFILFLTATLSALRFSHLNGYNIEYTMLFILTSFCVTVVFWKPKYLAVFYTVIITLLSISLITLETTVISKNTLLILFLLFFFVSFLNAVVKNRENKELTTNETRYRLLVSKMEQGLALLKMEEGGDFCFIGANDRFLQLTEISLEALVSQKLSKFSPEEYFLHRDSLIKIALNGGSDSFEMQINKDKKFFDIRAYSPQTKHIAIILNDITEHKLMQKTVFEEKQLLKATLLSVGEGVISTDKNGMVTLMNAIAEDITGCKFESANGKRCDRLINIVDEITGEKFNPVETTIKTDKILDVSDHKMLKGCCGKSVPVEYSCAPIRDENGITAGAIFIFKDISEKKEIQDRIRYLSYNDQLTGLYNRRYYEEQLSQLDNGKNLPLSIIMADVNGLKLTNDAFGHQKGDIMLKIIASIFMDTCGGGNNIVARIGGDEFVVILPQTDFSGAEKVAITLKQKISKTKLDNLALSVSFGYDTKTQLTDNILDTFKRAEDKMYLKKLSESTSMRSNTINIIMKALYEKSEREKLHSERVSEFCIKMAEALNFGRDDINGIRLAALMHDIGKTAIDINILDKPSKLTMEELKEIRKHSEIGYRILSSVPEFSKLAEYVLAHHERYDGNGYPKGLSGEAIPLCARIISIADSFDAMTSQRSYKRTMTQQEAISELKNCSGTQFDPKLVDLFINKVL